VKAKIMLGFLLLVFGAAFGSTVLISGNPAPICASGHHCQVEQKMFEGGPAPLCRPGVPCAVQK
jgi:hypothetical protein